MLYNHIKLECLCVCRYETRLERLVEELLDTQVVEGWGYPGGHPDLSNTQYAAMALRAAAAAGVSIPAKAWKRLADAVLDYAEPVQGVDSSGEEAMYNLIETVAKNLNCGANC